MKPAYRMFGVTMCVLVTLCIIGGTMGAQYARNLALKNEAQISGMDWAHHIENRLRHVHQNDETSPHLPTESVFATLLADIISVGNIYQIDYVNLSCLCDLSIGSYLDTARNDHPAAQDHSVTEPVLDPPAAKPNQARFNHLLFGKSDHRLRDPTQTAAQFPISRQKIVGYGQDDIHTVEIIYGDGINQPSVFAAVYHPVETELGPTYILRVLVNLEKHNENLNRFFIMSLVLILSMLLVVAGYPSLRFFRSAKHEQEADAAASYLAHHDVLTGLHNRNDFHAYLPALVKQANEQFRSVCLFLFDLNEFKDVNDSFGHQAGDEVLVAFANLLRKTAPEDAYIARLGGDEFVVVLCCERLYAKNPRDLLAIPTSCNVAIHGASRALEVGISGGVAMYPQHAATADGLMHAADLALHASKRDKSANIQTYSKHLKAAYQERLKLRQDIKNALEAFDIVPFYQPIVRLDTGEVTGFEALARWRQADGRYLAPGAFESVLDDADISAALGHCMLNQIVDDMARWQSQSISFGAVGLNVMNADLKQENFANNILDTLSLRNISPKKLTIEVTEHCLFDEKSSHPVNQLRILRDAGCNIALDDFGTGYSSISQLKSLPFTILKIDKQFVQNALNSADDQAIIRAMRFLGKSMDFKVILEGIEFIEQFLSLKANDHTLGQGYYFARPMPAADVPTYLVTAEIEHMNRQEIAG